MSPAPEREFGDLERMTIGFLAATIIFSLAAWAVGFVLMVFSKYWTTQEKVVAVVIPVALALTMFAISELLLAATQNWVRIPVMVTLALLAPTSSAIWLATRGFKPRRQLQLAT